MKKERSLEEWKKEYEASRLGATGFILLAVVAICFGLGFVLGAGAGFLSFGIICLLGYWRFLHLAKEEKERIEKMEKEEKDDQEVIENG